MAINTKIYDKRVNNGRLELDLEVSKDGQVIGRAWVPISGTLDKIKGQISNFADTMSAALYRTEETADVTPMIGQTFTQDELLTMDTIRVKRDMMLRETDFTQLSDSPISPIKKQEWAIYRQLLRDLPQSFATAQDVVFPIVPSNDDPYQGL